MICLLGGVEEWRGTGARVEMPGVEVLGWSGNRVSSMFFGDTMVPIIE